jgi:preprotein translocase subunit Sss1
LELNDKKDALPLREQEEQKSLVKKAGILTYEHNQSRKKLLNGLAEMEIEQEDIILKKRAKLAKEISEHEELKRVCIINKNPTSDELNSICSQQGITFIFFDVICFIKIL